MPNKPNFKLLLLCSVLILSANVVGFGCWCRDPGPVLDQFEMSKSVVTGRLASVSEREATLLVGRVYKGKFRAGDKLKFIQGTFGDCLRRFGSEEVGQQYLLYLDNPSNESIYKASICNRSNKLASAFDDLAYLDRMGQVAGKTRLSGYFKIREEITPNLEGLVVRMRGKDSMMIFSVKTDKNGFFEIYDLLPGDYVIEPQIPTGWRLDVKYMFGVDEGPSSKIISFWATVKAKRHTATTIAIVKDHSVYKQSNNANRSEAVAR